MVYYHKDWPKNDITRLYEAALKILAFLLYVVNHHIECEFSLAVLQA